MYFRKILQKCSETGRTLDVSKPGTTNQNQKKQKMQWSRGPYMDQNKWKPRWFETLSIWGWLNLTESYS